MRYLKKKKIPQDTRILSFSHPVITFHLFYYIYFVFFLLSFFSFSLFYNTQTFHNIGGKRLRFMTQKEKPVIKINPAPFEELVQFVCLICLIKRALINDPARTTLAETTSGPISRGGRQRDDSGTTAGRRQTGGRAGGSVAARSRPPMFITRPFTIMHCKNE